MTPLADASLERLCDLFASGNMRHAREIARILGQEIDEPRPSAEVLLAADILRRAAIILQAQQYDS
jgi:hypothetical protein